MSLGIASQAFAMDAVFEEGSLQDRYAKGDTIKVLIVPGHDDSFPGAKYKDIREADLNLSLANQIAKHFKDDKQIEVTVAREKNDYISSLRTYFDTQTVQVNEFIKSHADAMKKAIATGSVVVPKQVPHGNAARIPLYRLYAINKWSTEQKFDLVVHVHFNDEGRVSSSKSGKYSGYSVYVPDSNLLGAPISKELGTAIGKRLKRDFKRSDMSYEKSHSDKYGVIPDLKLIALGANRTSALPRVLIEYGYIYESSLGAKKFKKTSDVMAAATVYGIQDFLKGTK